MTSVADIGCRGLLKLCEKGTVCLSVKTAKVRPKNDIIVVYNSSLSGKVCGELWGTCSIYDEI